MGNNFEVTITATQTLTLQQSSGIYQPDMNTAYMWASASGQSTQTEPVELAFHPAVTAFQFTVGSPKALTFYSFEMSSSSQSLTGQVYAVISSSTSCAYTCPARTTANSVISVTFNGTTGIALPAGDSLKFTVSAMPQNLTNMSIKFVTSDGTRKLALNENVGGTMQPYVFEATKKYRITNMEVPCDEDWQFIIDEIPDVLLYGHSDASAGFNVKSYKVSDLDPDTKVEAQWKIQYKDASNNWVDITTSGIGGNDNSTFTFSSFVGSGVNNTTYSSGEGRTANIAGDNPNHGWANGTSEPASEVARHNLRAASPRGSASSPFDLSMHPVYGSIDDEYSDHKMNTANSYVIFAPGYYKFPLVYGNAMLHGNDNRAAYWPAKATTTSVNHPAVSYLSEINSTYNQDQYVNHYYLPPFYNALNQGITKPYILEDLNLSVSAVEAVVLWQDKDYADDPVLIPYDDSQIGITSNGYIWFNIGADVIRPGNIVIALRRKSDSLILWSWHIWITDKNLSPTDQVRGINLMPFNLGFVEGSDGAVDKYTDRSRLFRVTSYTVEGGNVVEQAHREFNVIQKGDAKEYAPSIGSNPYYQWGRKDPIIPSLPGGGTRWIIRNDDYPDLPANNPNQACIALDILPAALTANYATSITKPYKPLFNSATTSWVGGPVYPFAKGFVPNRLDGNPFTFSQLITTVNNRLTVNGLVPDGSWINEYRPEMGPANDPNSYVYFLDHYNPDLANNPLTFDEVQNLVGIDQTSHFTGNDFDAVPASTAAQRSASAVAYNLWNSYIYSDNVNTKDNKFKTIYDPCPPGFTVPVRYLFVGETWPLTWKPSEPGTPIHRENDNPMRGISPFVTVDRTSSTQGVFYDGAFFPYTGGRILIYTDLTAQEQGTGAYYWTDNPFNMQGTQHAPGDPDAIGAPADPTNIAHHWFYQYGLILSTKNGGSSVTSSHDKAWSFTKGSAAAIRPMVDPNF